MDHDNQRDALKVHASDLARLYRGQFVGCDLNKEMIEGNYYEARLGPNITRDMVAWM